MKKLLVLAAVIVAGVAANAASFKWQANNIYGPDGTTKYTGLVTLMAYESTSDISTAFEATTFTPTTAGVVNKTFESDAFTADTSYNFYMVMTETVGGQEMSFTSATKENIVAQATLTPNVSFGNMASATQASGAWTAVPEPTSGLLMLLGMAGLALRRRRA